MFPTNGLKGMASRGLPTNAHDVPAILKAGLRACDVHTQTKDLVIDRYKRIFEMSNIAFEFVEFPAQHVVVHVVTITHNTCAPKQLMSRNRNQRKHNYMWKQSRFLEMPQ